MTPEELMEFARTAEQAGVKEITFGTQVRMEGDDLSSLAVNLMDLLDDEGTVVLGGVTYPYRMERYPAVPGTIAIVIGNPLEPDEQDRPTPRLDALMSRPGEGDRES